MEHYKISTKEKINIEVSMPEPETTNSENQIREQECMQQRIAYYTLLLNSWVDSRNQETRFYINSSVGGIGILITVLSILMGDSNIKLFTPLVSFLYVAGLFLFLLSTIVGGITYRLNAQVAEKQCQILLNNENGEVKSIVWIDYLLYFLFYLGLLFSLAFFLTFFFKKINMG